MAELKYSTEAFIDDGTTNFNRKRQKQSFTPTTMETTHLTFVEIFKMFWYQKEVDKSDIEAVQDDRTISSTEIFILIKDLKNKKVQTENETKNQKGLRNEKKKILSLLLSRCKAFSLQLIYTFLN